MIELLVLLVWVIIFCVVGGILYWLTTLLPLPAPFPTIIRVAVIVICILLMLELVFGNAPMPHLRGF